MTIDVGSRRRLFVLLAVMLLALQAVCETIDEPTEEVKDNKCSSEILQEQEDEMQSEINTRFTIAFGAFLLALTYLSGYFLERFHIRWFPEAGAGIGIGILAGLLVRAMGTAKKVEEMVQFDPQFFFVCLLPPIIFEAGYNMKRQAFFRNMFAICLYAFIGTTVSCFIVGALVYAVGKAGWCHPLSGLASMVFGALISATDPVTVLAVFNAVHANIDLYSLVFGESVLNDAVAIVLYHTLLIFKCKPVTAVTVVQAFFSFVGIFVGSVVVGVLWGLLSAIIFKYTDMYKEKDFLFMELTLLTTFPYLSFMTAEGIKLSGIVSIMFCGITMSHYTYNNLSPEAKDTSRLIYKVMANLAETFVFIYLGMAMFSYKQHSGSTMLIVLSFLIINVARVFNVVPNSAIANLWRKPGGTPARIDWNFQFVLWWSGLRGAVAFVIAVTSWSNGDFPENDEGLSILTTTLFIAVITVFLMGGSISFFLEKFQLREKSAEEDEASYPAPGEPPLMVRDRSTPVPHKSSKFVYIDRKFVKPFLTRYKFEEQPAVAAAAPAVAVSLP